MSSEGARHGLWWPSEEGEPASPLGPLIADAVREGYELDPADEAAKTDAGSTTDTKASDAHGTASTEGNSAAQSEESVDESRPYHGYHYRLLTRQGPFAPGGTRDYIVGGRMIGGFAVLAYPANHGNSGIMTFIMSHQGTIYEKDLGPDTDSLVVDIDSFDPGQGWKKVEAKYTSQ